MPEGVIKTQRLKIIIVNLNPGHPDYRSIALTAIGYAASVSDIPFYHTDPVTQSYKRKQPRELTCVVPEGLR